VARRLFSAVGLAAAFAIGACGDSGSSDPDGVAASGDRAQIESVLAAVQQAYDSADGEGVCSQLSARGERLAGRSVFSKAGDCAAVVEDFAQRARKAGLEQKPSRVTAVKVRGTKAVAMVSDGGRPPAPVRFVREAGSWKLASLGLGSPPR
jgi:hypothetical protein